MKDIFDYLNDVKINANEYEDLPVNGMEREKIKKDVKSKIKRKKAKGLGIAVTAASLVIGIVVVTTNSEVIVTAIEKVFSKNPIESFEGYSDIKIDPYRTIIEQAVTSNGITITLNEVNFIYRDVLITYTITSNDQNVNDIKANPVIYFNGQRIKGVTATSHGKQKMNSIIIKDAVPRGGDLDVKVVFGMEGGPAGESDINQSSVITKGNWEFNFKANYMKMPSQVKRYKVNKNIRLSDGREIYIEEIVTTPISTYIESKIKNNGDMNLKGDGYFELSIKDSNNNDVKNIGFNAKREINENGTLGPNSTALHYFENIDESAESIRITAILEDYTLKKQSFEIKLK